MKIKKIIGNGILAILLVLSVQNAARSAECVDPKSGVLLNDVFSQYKNYSKEGAENSYEICFTGQWKISSTLSINTVVNDQLTIKNLDIMTRDSFVGNTLLTLSGSVVLDGAKLTGSGTGTGIEVKGTNAVIKDSTIDGFAEWLKVDAGAAVNLSKNTFWGTATQLDNLPVQLPILFNFLNGAVSPVKAMIGKTLKEGDSSKAQAVVGELGLTAEECAGGTLEMNVIRPLQNINQNKLPLHVQETAKCDAPKVLDEDVSLEFSDGTKATIAKGKCAFACSDFNENLSTQVLFAHTGANGQTGPFSFAKRLGEIPTVISVMGPLSMPGVGSEASGGGAGGGSDGAALIFIPAGPPPAGGIEGAEGATADLKTQSSEDGGGKSSGSAGSPPPSSSNTVGGKSGGCSSSISGADSADSPLAIIFALIPLFAVPPLAWRRVNCRSSRHSRGF